MKSTPYSEPTTSKESAKNLSKHKRLSDRQRILNYIMDCGEAGATDQEIASVTGIPGDTLRPRRGELASKGLIVKADFTRETHSGRKAAVWVA